MASEEQAEIIELETLAKAILDAHDKLTSKSIRAVDMATVTGTLLDVKSGGALLRELGYKGSYYLKNINGIQYVILRGRPGLRDILTGTNYLPANPKIVTLGIGPQAIKSAAKTNGFIMIIAYTVLDVTSYILSDEQTLSDLFGNLIVNIAIGAVAIAAGTLFALGTAAVATVVVPSALVATGGIAVGMLVSVGLGWAADKFQLREKLSDAIDWTMRGLKEGLVRVNEVVENAHHTIREKHRHVNRSLNRFHKQFEREIIWRATRGRFYSR